MYEKRIHQAVENFMAGYNCAQSVVAAFADLYGGKSANYAVVQDLVARFRAEHGSSICRELLGLRKDAPTPPMADERTAEYYKKRPCVYMVESAARLYARFLTERAEAGLPLRAKMEG